MYRTKDNYTPAEARRANDELDRLVAAKTLTTRQAGAHRRHIAHRTRLVLNASYSPLAAKRAKTEIDKLAEAGAIAAVSTRAYRAHITKRTKLVTGTRSVRLRRSKLSRSRCPSDPVITVVPGTRSGGLRLSMSCNI
jgi:hypothetical protein